MFQKKWGGMISESRRQINCDVTQAKYDTMIEQNKNKTKQHECYNLKLKSFETSK